LDIFYLAAGLEYIGMIIRDNVDPKDNGEQEKLFRKAADIIEEALKKVKGTYQVLPGPTRSYQVLSGLTRSYQVLPGTPCLFLPGPTRSSQVHPGQVLLGPPTQVPISTTPQVLPGPPRFF
jgi:hypothetical protein